MLHSHIKKIGSKLKKFRLLFILLPYVILASVGFYFGYQRCKPTFVKDGVKYTRNICGSIKSAQKMALPTNPNEKKVNAKVYTNTENNYWEIIDTNKNPHVPTGLKISEKNIPNSTVVRWNNFLLGVNLEQYLDKTEVGYAGPDYSLRSQIRSIRVYNINTGETFDIALEQPILGEFWYVNSQVVDNSYYFGVGGAFGASLGYKLDLPPNKTSRITGLKSPLGNRVEKFGRTYVSSFCYEGCSYSLFNPTSLTVTPLERMSAASNDRDYARKEEFIGIDSQGRMILNVRTIPKTVSPEQYYFETETLAAVPLDNESTTIPLLKATDLPEKIYHYFMIDGTDAILMLTKSTAYIYNLADNTFKPLPIGPTLKKYLPTNNQGSISYAKNDNVICFGYNETSSSAIDLVKQTYFDSAPNECKKVVQEKSEEDIFKELNLPTNFEFIYTPNVYKTYSIINGISESELPKDAEIIE